MTALARYTPDMVPKMSTIELRFAVKQLSGADVTSRNTPALRKRVIKLLAERGAAVPIEVRVGPEPALAPVIAAKRVAKPKRKAEPKPPAFAHDHRVLAVYKIGEAIEKRDAKGTLIARVTVEKDGFSWHGKTYESLTPIATEVSGTAQGGLVYFGVIPYNDRDRKGRTTADMAPAFDAALGVFNLVAKGLGLDTIDVRGLAALETSEDHEGVRSAVARLRSYATQMRAQLQALALGENLLEVRHGRAPESR